MLNHFATPLGLSLATLLSQLFLPPAAAAKLQRQGFQGRQVVLAQNSRDFVFVRRYRYMFALKSHRLGKTKKQADLARMTEPKPDEEIDDTVKTRFQEIGPQFTLKMRWIRRGPLGETQDERQAREQHEQATGEGATEYGDSGAAGANGEEDEEGMDATEEGMAVDGDEDDEEADALAEAEAKHAIGLDATDAAGQPNFTNMEDPTVSAGAAGEAEAGPSDPAPQSKKRPRGVPRVRQKPYHALLNPPPDSDSDSPEPESVPLPMNGKKKNPQLQSAFDTVGHTWHAGKGEGGVRESAKRREWNWEVSLLDWLRRRFLAPSALPLKEQFADPVTPSMATCRPACKFRGASSSCDPFASLRLAPLFPFFAVSGPLVLRSCLPLSLLFPCIALLSPRGLPSQACTALASHRRACRESRHLGRDGVCGADLSAFLGLRLCPSRCGRRSAAPACPLL